VNRHDQAYAALGTVVDPELDPPITELGFVTGDFISAEEACAKGLVNRVAAAEALDDEVEALVALGKALFYHQLEQGIVSAYEDAGATMACNMMDPSALEGVQAFIDKRVPKWIAGQA
jgi:enoyl-CoA hydratase/carnithine racemase